MHCWGMFVGHHSPGKIHHYENYSGPSSGWQHKANGCYACSQVTHQLLLNSGMLVIWPVRPLIAMSIMAICVVDT